MTALINEIKPKMHEADLIRVGGKHDGGYVLPKSIFNGESLNIVTIGVGYEYSFEKDILKKGKDVNILMYDFSCGFLGTIERMFNNLKLRKYLGSIKPLIQYILLNFFFLSHIRDIRFVAKYISSGKDSKSSSIDEIIISGIMYMITR